MSLLFWPRGFMVCDNCHKDSFSLFRKYKFYNPTYETLLDDQINVLHVCQNCIDNDLLVKWSEAQFCKAVGVNPYNVQVEILKRKSCCGN